LAGWIAVIANNMETVSNIVNATRRRPRFLPLTFPVLLLLAHCASLRPTANIPPTPSPQVSGQPETPKLSPEEQLDLFNRHLDRA
jgi:hypothetical protein